MSYQDPYQSGYGQQQPQPEYGQQPPPGYGQQPPPGYGPQPGYDPAYNQPYSGGPSYPVTGPGQVPAPYMGPMVIAPSAPTNTMAILALVFAFVFPPLGIVFGHIGRKQCKERGEQGDGLALAGMIVGYIHTGIWVLLCAFYIIFFVILLGAASTTSNDYGDYVIRLVLGG
jgi:hypothetical protein